MSKSGVILLQEWWGVTEEIHSQAMHLSQLGYHVVVPDLYRGCNSLRPFCLDFAWGFDWI